MRLLLGFDFGTSYLKVGLFDETGALRGLGRTRVAAPVDESGRCERRSEEFWRRAREALAEALQTAAARPAEIAGISYSSQANTFIALDRTGEPLTPLISWTDRRAPVELADAEFSRTPEFQQTVGFAGVSPESAVSKWRWLQRHEPGLWQRSHRLMTLSDYVTWSLTGESVGDASTAALLGLYDLSRRTWWPAAGQHYGIDPERLSQPLLPATTSGATSGEAGRLLGLPAGIPFAVGALDHHAAAIGAGLEGFVDVSTSAGTVLAATALVNEVRPMPRCFHGPHIDGRRYFRLAFSPAGAGELEAFQQRHAPGETIEQLIAEAMSATTRDAATTEESGPSHANSVAIAAIVKRMADAQRDLVESVISARIPRAVAATGGGARSAAWLQLLANTLGVPVVAPASAELACLGAAVFAAVAAGIHREHDAAARAMVQRGQLVAPEDP